MHVVVAGSSGFLGTHLREHLTRHGHEVTRLVRGAADGPDESSWDPYADELDTGLIAGADVVVNLAGSPTAGNPHSKRWARELRESRVTTTSVLADAVAACDRPPAFLAGNGISFYGDHGSKPVDEQADSRGEALLTTVSREWGEVTRPAAEAGARVCVLRTSPVLDRRSPPLNALRRLFRLGLGGRLGTGNQYFPVISLRDWVDAVGFLAVNESSSGPFNLCCPQTPTNAEFTTALGAAVHRPTLATVPGPVLRRAAGALAPEVLGSIRGVPAALERDGFEFAHRDIRAVLDAALSGV